MNQLVLMTHVFFGMACIIGAVWVFVDVLNDPATNHARIRYISCAVAAVMWVSFLIGGFRYVVFYKTDKSIILKGPWPFAHNFFMETKEHLVIMLLLLATYLPIAARNNLTANRGARQLVLCVCGLIVLMGLLMEGDGGIIAMGVKVALLAR